MDDDDGSISNNEEDYSENAVIPISNEERTVFKFIDKLPFSEFIEEGLFVLGLHPEIAWILKVDDETRIVDDKGLEHCANKSLVVAFVNSTGNAKVTKMVLHDAKLPEKKEMKQWPVNNYQLPELKASVEMKILDLQTTADAEKLKKCNLFCIGFLNPLIRDLENYVNDGSSLSEEQLRDVGEAIRRTYPMLLDSDGSWTTLKMKLSDRMLKVKSKTNQIMSEQGLDRSRRSENNEHNQTTADEMDGNREMTNFIAITNEDKTILKILCKRPIMNFIRLGLHQLDLPQDFPTQLRTEDGTMVENDEDIEYCAANNLHIIFGKAPVESSSAMESECTDNRSLKPWFANYELPQFSDEISRLIAHAISPRRVAVLKKNKSFRNNFISEIVKDLLKNMRVSRSEDISVVNKTVEDAILQTYPYLADDDGSCSSWTSKLKQTLLLAWNEEDSLLRTRSKRSTRTRPNYRSMAGYKVEDITINLDDSDGEVLA